MTYKLKIAKYEKAFQNAHRHILTRFDPMRGQSMKQVVNTWQQVFKVKIHRVEGRWDIIEFENEQQCAVWLLKWSE
jgi:hypothetical protein